MLPVRREKGNKKGRKPDKTEPGPTSPLWASQELRKRVLVSTYLYTSRGGAQRGYIIYTRTDRHTGVVVSRTAGGASCHAAGLEIPSLELSKAPSLDTF